MDFAYFDQHKAVNQKFDPEQTVLDYFWSLYPNLLRNDVRSALGAFLFSGEDVEKKMGQLSGGEKVRLELCRIFYTKPNFLILDEPTSGLDPVVRDDLLDLFLEFVQDEEHAILISTHITSDLEKVADYVTFLHAGKLLLSKPKDELLWQYGILRCGEALFQKLESPEVLAWRKKDYSYDVLVPDREAILRKYPEAVIDQVTMDEILLLYVKGVQGK